MIVCSRCGANEDDASASFAEEGLVCAACAVGEVSRDAAQMRAQLAEASGAGRGLRLQLGEPGLSASLASSQRVEQVTGTPPTPLQAALEGRGLSVRRLEVSKTVTTPLGTKVTEGVRETWTLPSAPAVQASFSPEGIGRKIVKLFKKELQTGDHAFDAAVYIGTDTRDATAAFLARPEVRALIGDIVGQGGWIRIAGSTVEGESLWPVDEPSVTGRDGITRVVAALIDS